MTSTVPLLAKGPGTWVTPGLFWLLVALVGAAVFFADGLDALLTAWALPEYSHGPLIPILSGLLFLRQLKEYPVDPGPKRNRWVGVTVIVLALMLATLGKLSSIADLVAYATILWVGGILLVSFGWETGRHFWPPVLHLVYMLPLPGVIYFKLTTWLQFISSELGVWFLRLLSVPVFLDGNIIDLGITRLHVAEACSGLRYLFPILSFSYIFAVLYKGPMWHKAVLLISAAPITVFMNSVRIAIAGLIVQYWGLDWLEGFTHFFEGWVIFIACILILFALARIMLFLHPVKMGLAEALDLDTEGLACPGGAAALHPRLDRDDHRGPADGGGKCGLAVPSCPNATAPGSPAKALPPFPGAWATGSRRAGRASLPRRSSARWRPMIIIAATFRRDGDPATVEVFSAWYADQSQGGVHSPEICLPGGGWEIAWLERTDLTRAMDWDRPFMVNRAIIQKGETRMMVYYWFEQKGRKIAWDMAAKFWLLADGIRTGRTDGALVRLTTPILPDESDASADARLKDVLKSTLPVLPKFVPDA